MELSRVEDGKILATTIGLWGGTILGNVFLKDLF